MKNFKRLFLLLFVLVATVLCFSPSLKRASAASLKTITVHYYRYDNTYSHFGWFWTENTKGQGIMMTTPSDYGRKAVFNVDGHDEEEFGLLFCKTNSGVAGSWGGEQTSDFYFTKADLKDISGTNANVYYIQGCEFPVFSQAEAKEAMKHKFLYLTFTDKREITYRTTKGAVSNLKLTAGGQNISITDKGSNGYGKFTIGADLDFSKEYVISATIAGQAVTQTVGYGGLYTKAAWNDVYGYDGELGAIYTPEATTFKLWAPVSQKITVNLYKYGHPTELAVTGYPGDDTPYKQVEMEKGEKGVWSVKVEEDLDGVYYTYTVQNSETTINEIVDPYAKSTGVNGLRGMVVNLASEKLNPANWESDKSVTVKSNVDYVIYETHVRDLTAHKTWGGEAKYAGTFLGLAQRGTTYKKSGVTVSTGLDHIIEMGVNAVHLLPVMDSLNVDETKLNDEEYKNKDEDGIYNWNYMTANFFTLDGGFSTNPYDGYARMNEFKQLVMAFHENDINLIMDVVFNHTSVASTSNFHKIIPYYYHRTVEGSLTNGSGCGNEMASEHYMVRKLIVDSCSHFAKEFHVDGFRFDLMGLEDTETMNQLYNATSKINPNMIIYGEPWQGGTSTNAYKAASKANMNAMPNIASFCDVSREGVRGDNNAVSYGGWVTNDLGYQQFDKTVYGITGGLKGISSIHSANPEYSYLAPTQVINYASCHDNYTLYDQISVKGGTILRDADSRMEATTQSIALMLTSQGVPFIEAGSEFGRTKGKYPADYSIVSDRNQRVHNSYNLGDKFNVLDWSWKITNKRHAEAIAQLVKIRTKHEAFRQTTYNDVKSVLLGSTSTMYYDDGKLISYRLKDTGDNWNDILVIHSNASGASSFTLPTCANKAGWKIVYSNTGDNAIDTFKKAGSAISVGQNETLILVGNEYTEIPDEPTPDLPTPDLPTIPEEDFDNPLLDLYKVYVQYGLSQLNQYDAATQVEILTATRTFINASYNSEAELKAAYNTLKSKVDKITENK